MQQIKNILELARRHKVLLGSVMAMGVLLVWGATVWFNLATRSERFDLERTPPSSLPSKDVAIVFGAGLYRSTGKPTAYLQWRVETAVQLYKAHRVRKLLMSGDNTSRGHSEPVAMRDLAMSLGVPSEDIVLDLSGFNTYDTCYRAHAIFKVKSAVIVTQGYHLPRALFACEHLGTPSIGVDAEHDKGHSWKAQYIAREWLSTDKIVFQLIFKPHPAVLGKAEPI